MIAGLSNKKIEIPMLDGFNRETLQQMVVNNYLEDVWLQKIPWMLCQVTLLVMLDFSCKLVVVVGLCYHFFENDELQHFLFLDWLKSGRIRRVFKYQQFNFFNYVLFEPVLLSLIHFLRTLQHLVHLPILFWFVSFNLCPSF